MQILMLFPILVPIIGGILMQFLDMEDRKKRQMYVGAIAIISMLLTVFVLFSFHDGQSLQLFHIVRGISITFAVDSLSVVFGLMVSILWVFTTFYAFGYMSHEGNEVRFFSFFLMAMGVSAGLALAGNPVTLYLFYELLTFITFPLIIHAGTKEALAAGRKYLGYSVFGATLGLISIAAVTFISNGAASEAGFTFGGVLTQAMTEGNSTMIHWMYFLGFLGFSVKSAVFPMHGWLPSAYVAPTPATALLHAVAVVKAGIFGIMRLTYYVYDFEFFKGSWVQIVCLGMIFVTILYGSAMALRTRHLKKRLAYSTISQLSYILFGVMMLSVQGLHAALVYMVIHAVIKITLFFCCGSIMFTTGTTDVREMNDYGRLMPTTFVCFAVASLALTGVPPIAGFFGKFYLLRGALLSEQNILAIIGCVVIAISVLLTALYLLPVALRAFFPAKGKELEDVSQKSSMNFMSVPIMLLSVLMFLMGVAPSLLTNFIEKITI